MPPVPGRYRQRPGTCPAPRLRLCRISPTNSITTGETDRRARSQPNSRRTAGAAFACLSEGREPRSAVAAFRRAGRHDQDMAEQNAGGGACRLPALFRPRRAASPSIRCSLDETEKLRRQMQVKPNPRRHVERCTPGDNRPQRGWRTQLFCRLLAATPTHRYALTPNPFPVCAHLFDRQALERDATSRHGRFTDIGGQTSRGGSPCDQGVWQIATRAVGAAPFILDSWPRTRLLLGGLYCGSRNPVAGREDEGDAVALPIRAQRRARGQIRIDEARRQQHRDAGNRCDSSEERNALLKVEMADHAILLSDRAQHRIGSVRPL
jgi:hypothetical protein